MTLRQSETLLRALVALALGFGFVGFASHAHSELNVHAAVEVEATPAANVAHAGI